MLTDSTQGAHCFRAAALRPSRPLRTTARFLPMHCASLFDSRRPRRPSAASHAPSRPIGRQRGYDRECRSGPVRLSQAWTLAQALPPRRCTTESATHRKVHHVGNTPRRNHKNRCTRHQGIASETPRTHELHARHCARAASSEGHAKQPYRSPQPGTAPEYRDQACCGDHVCGTRQACE